MKFKSHLVAASIVSASVPFLAKEVGINFSFYALVQIMPAIVLGGAISCDIDTNSKASKYYAIIGILLTFYWLYMGYIFHPLIIWIPFGLAKSGNHRGFTHSWLLPLGIIFLPMTIDFIIFHTDFEIRWIHQLIIKYRLSIIGYTIGIVTHLLIDIKVLKKLIRFIGKEKAVKMFY